MDREKLARELVRLAKELTSSDKFKVKILSWSGTEYDSDYEKGDTGILEITNNGFVYKALTGEASYGYSDTIDVYAWNMKESGNKIMFTGNGKKISFQKIKVASRSKVAKYEIYHDSYTSAVQEAKRLAEKKGYEIDEDEWFRKISTGPRKPSVGKTLRHSLSLTKNGKPQRRTLEIQVYGMDNGYELNAYVS
jgi:hypothetical protein